MIFNFFYQKKKQTNKFENLNKCISSLRNPWTIVFMYHISGQTKTNLYAACESIYFTDYPKPMKMILSFWSKIQIQNSTNYLNHKFFLFDLNHN